MKFPHKKVYLFDLDGTLAESKMPLMDSMVETLKELLLRRKVGIISGASYPQMKKQFGILMDSPQHAANLYLLPTNGSMFYVHDGAWKMQYALSYSPEEKRKVFESFEIALKKAGFKEPEEMYGELIEDRETQITFSAHGMQAPPELKKRWDPDQRKRKEIVEHLAPLLEEYEIKIAGGTSIDVTRRGIDKAYGTQKLMEHGPYTKEEILFFGDMIFPGGNDYPVKEMGIDTVHVRDHFHTEAELREHLLE